MLQTLSQRQDRDQYLPAITTMLGLRGHMYGELIRIQTMLAKDDPHMNVMHALHRLLTVCLKTLLFSFHLSNYSICCTLLALNSQPLSRSSLLSLAVVSYMHIACINYLLQLLVKVKVPGLTTPYSNEDCRRRGKRV